MSTINESGRSTIEMIRETKEFLNAKGVVDPEVGIVLGSGLNGYADRLEDPIILSYDDIPNMEAGRVSDHRGQLVYGEYLGKKVIIMAGRFHYYENHSMEKTVYPTRVMIALGIKRLILTNAAGCVSTDFGVGHLMLIKDHINYSGDNPLIGTNIDEFGPRFPDMTYTYNRELRNELKRRASEEWIILDEGVYMMFTGPSFETPAEIRMARAVGADAVGMSTVPEAIVANHAGIEIIGLSVLTNMAAGVLDKPITGEEMNAEVESALEQCSKVLDMAIEI